MSAFFNGDERPGYILPLLKNSDVYIYFILSLKGCLYTFFIQVWKILIFEKETGNMVLHYNESFSEYEVSSETMKKVEGFFLDYKLSIL